MKLFHNLLQRAALLRLLTGVEYVIISTKKESKHQNPRLNSYSKEEGENHKKHLCEVGIKDFMIIQAFASKQSLMWIACKEEKLSHQTFKIWCDTEINEDCRIEDWSHCLWNGFKELAFVLLKTILSWLVIHWMRFLSEGGLWPQCSLATMSRRKIGIWKKMPY